MAAAFTLGVVLRGIDQLSGPLGRMETRLSRFGKRASSVGRKISTALTLPALLIGGGIISAGADFEAAMIGVRIQTGATGDSLQAFEDQALEIGQSTIFTATQVAKTQEILGKAGIKSGENLLATAQVVNFAAAADLELADSASILVKVMLGQELGAKDLVGITDSLITVQKSAAVSVEELSEGFGAGGSIAKIYGIQMAETASAIAELNQRGTEGAQAGTAIRNAIVRLATPVPKAAKILEGLGLSKQDFFTAEGQLKGLAAAIDTLKEADIRPEHLTDLFGLKTGPAFLKLFQEGVTDRMREVMELTKESGVTARDAAARMEGLTGAIKGLASAIETLSIKIGKSGVLKWFEDTTRGATEYTRAMSDADEETLSFGAKVGGLATVIGPTLIALGFLGNALSWLATGMNKLFSPIKKLAVFIGKVLIVPVLALAGAFFSTPFGWVVAGLASVTAGSVAVWRNWELIKTGAKDVGNAIRTGIGSALDWLGGRLDAFLDLMPDWLLNALASVSSAGGSVIDFLGSPIGGSSGPAIGPAGSGGGGTVDPFSQNFGGGESRILVDFANVPAGTKITQDDSDIPVDLSLGVSLGL